MMGCFYLLKKAICLIGNGKTCSDKRTILFSFVKGIFVKDGQLSKSVTVVNREGEYYCGIRRDSVFGASIFCEPHTRPFLNLNKGAFVDVGANIGKYTVIVGRKYPSNKIVAVEPETENVEILKKNIELNNLVHAVVCPYAASSKKGVAFFYLTLGHPGGHSLCKKTENKIEIKTETLDNLLAKSKIGKVDLIKIDVEGNEEEVLKGAIKTLTISKPNLIFEAWTEESLANMKKILVPLGYKVEHIARHDYFAFIPEH